MHLLSQVKFGHYKQSIVQYSSRIEAIHHTTKVTGAVGLVHHPDSPIAKWVDHKWQPIIDNTLKIGTWFPYTSGTSLQEICYHDYVFLITVLQCCNRRSNINFISPRW